MSIIDNVRGILLDIEGTTTPIDFVHQVLFSYARDEVSAFLATSLEASEVQGDIELLRIEHDTDASENRNPPALDTTDIDSIAAYVKWLIALDRKSMGLKSLQGKIWRRGYEDGALKSQVFPDVRPALERWDARGLNVSIFSSGSVLAQQLLFAHTEVGDLTGFIYNYFDTKVGKKGEAESYRRIASDLELKPEEIVFISDVVEELDAADEAGMKTLLSIRPGNKAQADVDRYTQIVSFDSI